MKVQMTRKIKILLGICFFLAGLLLLPDQTAFATTVDPGPVKIAVVDYYDDNVFIFNNGNTRIYYATEVEAAKDNWEVIPADQGSFTEIDMSWLSPTVDNIIIVKGDLDQTQTRFIMKEKPRKLEISVNYEKLDELALGAPIAPLVNIMASEGSGAAPIDFYDLEWKKGENGSWQSSRSLTRRQIEKYLVKGTYLYFRIMANNDYGDIIFDAEPTPIDGEPIILDGDSTLIQGDPIRVYPGLGNRINMNYIDDYYLVGIDYSTLNADGTKGRRFSYEVKVKIAKKASPMVYGIDGEEFTAEIKYGKEYRVSYEKLDPDDNPYLYTSPWIKVTDRSVKSLDLEDIVANGVSDGTISDNAFPAMKLEIRDYATAKAAASKATEIELEPQRILAGTVKEGKAPLNATSADKNIYVAYNGIKNMIITIPSASPEVPYEYCVIKPDDVFDFKYAVWGSITKGTEVKVLASKAVQNGVLYVRQKEIKSKEATRTTPAISYALASTYLTHTINYPSIPVSQKATFTYTKKYTTNTPLTFTIVLNELGKKPFETQIRNIKLGTREIGYDVSVTTNASEISTMTVVLKSTSLEAMTNCYNRPITINFMNGTVDKTSIKLTIQNATPAGTLSTSVAKGTATGTTAIDVVSGPATGNRLVYQIGTTAVTNANIEDTLTTGTNFTNNANITVPAGQYITVYELDSTNHIVKFKSILIIADLIL